MRSKIILMIAAGFGFLAVLGVVFTFTGDTSLIPAGIALAGGAGGSGIGLFVAGLFLRAFELFHNDMRRWHGDPPLYVDPVEETDLEDDSDEELPSESPG